MTHPKKILRTIRRHKTFLVTTHVNPDPDALCSEIGMAMCLRALGKKVHIVNEEKIPARFAFLPGAGRIQCRADWKSLTYDAAVVVDCGELERVGKVRELISDDKILINIDHHITNDFFGDLNLVLPKASSTAEILYTFLKHAGCRLTKDLAVNLYVGIMTDTGCFRFENTTALTHRIIADLMRFRLPVSDLYRRIYESVPAGDLKKLMEIVGRCELLDHGRLVCLSLSKRTVSKFSEDFDVRDTIFKFLRSMNGVEVAAIFTEVARRQTRVNLRSVHRVDVARIASRFQGGGHQRASGCTIHKALGQARADVIGQIQGALIHD